MKKYRKPMLDIIEFDNMDVIMSSGSTSSSDEEDTNETGIAPINERASDEQTSGPDENAGSAEPSQDSGESPDGPGVLAPQEENSTEPEPNTDIDEPTGEPDTQSDDGLS